jgi:hypothetical protein
MLFVEEAKMNLVNQFSESINCVVCGCEEKENGPGLWRPGKKIML